MVKPNDGPRLLLKSPQALRIASKTRGQEFERGLSARGDVGGQIDIAHSAGADSFRQFVVANRLTNERIGRRSFKKLRRNPDHRRLDKIAGALVRGEERFDFDAQLVVTLAGRFEKASPLFRLVVQRRMENFLDRV